MKKERTPRRYIIFPFYVILGEDRCRNSSVGRLMDGFLVERLTPEEDEKFREHLLGCLYCSAFLSNFNNTRKASRFYGIPAGPELDPYMEEIHLSPLPKKLAKLSRELLRRLLESNPKIESIH